MGVKSWVGFLEELISGNKRIRSRCTLIDACNVITVRSNVGPVLDFKSSPETLGPLVRVLAVVNNLLTSEGFTDVVGRLLDLGELAVLIKPLIESSIESPAGSSPSLVGEVLA